MVDLGGVEWGWLELLMNGAFVDYSVSVWFGWNVLIGFHSDVRLSSLILLNIASVVIFPGFFVCPGVLILYHAITPPIRNEKIMGPMLNISPHM